MPAYDVKFGPASITVEPENQLRRFAELHVVRERGLDDLADLRF
jgi:hypothetical protein